MPNPDKKFKVESTPISPKNEIATKTQRHQGSPRVYISMIYSWCNFVPWSLGGKKGLFGADSKFKVKVIFDWLSYYYDNTFKRYDS